MRFYVGLTSLLLMLVGSAAARANQPPRDPRCSDLKDINIALRHMHERLRRWPGSSIATNPSRSWRVELLNYLDRADLAQKYKQTEPWNSPRNQALLAAAPDCYTPYDDLNVNEYFPDAPCLGDTWYLAPAGENTVWSGRVKNITDGMDRTIVLIEAPELRVPWLEPRDLTFDEAVELLGKPTKRYVDAFFYVTEYEANRSVHLANGTCHTLPPLPPDVAAALLTPYGRERVDIYNLSALPWRQGSPRIVYKWERIVPLLIASGIAATTLLIAIAVRQRLKAERQSLSLE